MDVGFLEFWRTVDELDSMYMLRDIYYHGHGDRGLWSANDKRLVRLSGRRGGICILNVLHRCSGHVKCGDASVCWAWNLGCRCSGGRIRVVDETLRPNSCIPDFSCGDREPCLVFSGGFLRCRIE